MAHCAPQQLQNISPAFPQRYLGYGTSVNCAHGPSSPSARGQLAAAAGPPLCLCHLLRTSYDPARRARDLKGHEIGSQGEWPFCARASRRAASVRAAFPQRAADCGTISCWDQDCAAGVGLGPSGLPHSATIRLGSAPSLLLLPPASPPAPPAANLPLGPAQGRDLHLCDQRHRLLRQRQQSTSARGASLREVRPSENGTAAASTQVVAAAIATPAAASIGSGGAATALPAVRRLRPSPSTALPAVRQGPPPLRLPHPQPKGAAAAIPALQHCTSPPARPQPAARAATAAAAARSNISDGAPPAADLAPLHGGGFGRQVATMPAAVVAPMASAPSASARGPSSRRHFTPGVSPGQDCRFRQRTRHGPLGSGALHVSDLPTGSRESMEAVAAVSASGGGCGRGGTPMPSFTTHGSGPRTQAQLLRQPQRPHAAPSSAAAAAAVSVVEEPRPQLGSSTWPARAGAPRRRLRPWPDHPTAQSTLEPSAGLDDLCAGDSREALRTRNSNGSSSSNSIDGGDSKASPRRASDKEPYGDTSRRKPALAEQLQTVPQRQQQRQQQRGKGRQVARAAGSSEALGEARAGGSEEAAPAAPARTSVAAPASVVPVVTVAAAGAAVVVAAARETLPAPAPLATAAQQPPSAAAPEAARGETRASGGGGGGYSEDGSVERRRCAAGQEYDNDGPDEPSTSYDRSVALLGPPPPGWRRRRLVQLFSVPRPHRRKRQAQARAAAAAAAALAPAAGGNVGGSGVGARRARERFSFPYTVSRTSDVPIALGQLRPVSPGSPPPLHSASPPPPHQQQHAQPWGDGDPHASVGKLLFAVGPAGEEEAACEAAGAAGGPACGGAGAGAAFGPAGSDLAAGWSAALAAGAIRELQPPLAAAMGSAAAAGSWEVGLRAVSRPVGDPPGATTSAAASAAATVGTAAPSSRGLFVATEEDGAQEGATAARRRGNQPPASAASIAMTPFQPPPPACLPQPAGTAAPAVPTAPAAPSRYSLLAAPPFVLFAEAVPEHRVVVYRHRPTGLWVWRPLLRVTPAGCLGSGLVAAALPAVLPPLPPLPPGPLGAAAGEGASGNAAASWPPSPGQAQGGGGGGGVNAAAGGGVGHQEPPVVAAADVATLEFFLAAAPPMGVRAAADGDNGAGDSDSAEGLCAATPPPPQSEAAPTAREAVAATSSSPSLPRRRKLRRADSGSGWSSGGFRSCTAPSQADTADAAATLELTRPGHYLITSTGLTASHPATARHAARRAGGTERSSGISSSGGGSNGNSVGAGGRNSGYGGSSRADGLGSGGGKVAQGASASHSAVAVVAVVNRMAQSGVMASPPAAVADTAAAELTPLTPLPPPSPRSPAASDVPSARPTAQQLQLHLPLPPRVTAVPTHGSVTGMGPQSAGGPDSVFPLGAAPAPDQDAGGDSDGGDGVGGCAAVPALATAMSPGASSSGAVGARCPHGLVASPILRHDVALVVDASSLMGWGGGVWERSAGELRQMWVASQRVRPGLLVLATSREMRPLEQEWRAKQAWLPHPDVLLLGLGTTIAYRVRTAAPGAAAAAVAAPYSATRWQLDEQWSELLDMSYDAEAVHSVVANVVQMYDGIRIASVPLPGPSSQMPGIRSGGRHEARDAAKDLGAGVGGGGCGALVLSAVATAVDTAAPSSAVSGVSRTHTAGPPAAAATANGDCAAEAGTAAPHASSCTAASAGRPAVSYGLKKLQSRYKICLEVHGSLVGRVVQQIEDRLQLQLQRRIRAAAPAGQSADGGAAIAAAGGCGSGGLRFEVQPRGPRGEWATLYVLPAAAGKAAALRHVMRRFNIDEAAVVAVGDTDRDVEMLRLAGAAIVTAPRPPPALRRLLLPPAATPSPLAPGPGPVGCCEASLKEGGLIDRTDAAGSSSSNGNSSSSYGGGGVVVHACGAKGPSGVLEGLRLLGLL